MTDSEKHEVWVALRAVSDAINEIEKQTNRQILKDRYQATIANCDLVFFTGYNDIEYSIPSKLFLRLPQKRVVIEVARALTIDTNDYGMGI